MESKEKKRIYSVYEDQLSLDIEKTHPPTLKINAVGKTRSGGWVNAELNPYVYINPPVDGIYEFDFIAQPVNKPGTDALTDVEAQFSWLSFPDDLKGVRIYAETNKVEKNIER